MHDDIEGGYGRMDGDDHVLRGLTAGYVMKGHAKCEPDRVIMD